MSTTCRKCGALLVTDAKVLDVPKGVVLCGDCFEEYVWTCDSCAKQIALPDVEGGELEAITPLVFEHWCQACCDEKTAPCEKCGGEDLVEDMTSTEDGLLCERCAAGHGASVVDESPLITKENWKNAVLAAIDDLPDDIALSIGHHAASDDCLEVRVACEPLGKEDGETIVTKVRVRWWKTRREEIESIIHESPRIGMAILESESKRPSIDEPTISIEPGGATGPTTGPVPGKASVAMLKGMIQEAILNELHEGGGVSMVHKDRKGRFVREDGTYVLGWQRPPGS